MIHRGRVRNGIVVPDDPAGLPEGAPVVIQAAEPFGFSENPSIAQLAERQGVRPIDSLRDLRGDWPAEDCLDDFLATVREARK